MTLPRRGPVSPEQRAREIARVQAAGASGYGQTPNARPVAAPQHAQTIPPIPTGLGVLARATFRDPSGSVAFGANADLSQQTRFYGPTSQYFAYNAGSIQLLLAGWYMVAATGPVTGAAAGNVIRVYANLTTVETAEAIDIADGSGSANPKVVMLPFWDDGSGTVVGTSTINQSGLSGSVNFPSLHLVALSGAAGS